MAYGQADRFCTHAVTRSILSMKGCATVAQPFVLCMDRPKLSLNYLCAVLLIFSLTKCTGVRACDSDAALCCYVCNRFGERFPAMSTAYDPQLRQLAKQVADDLDMKSFVLDGVYVYLGGPCYETIAECRMARSMGGDVVGTLASKSLSLMTRLENT